MINISKLVFNTLMLCMAFTAIHAQNNTRSPYSARGVGELESFNTAYNRSLGGVSNGIRSTRFVSLSNPASLSGLKQVVFDFGASGSYGQQTQENVITSKTTGNTFTEQTLYTFYNGNLSYIFLGFPVWQKEVLAKDTSSDKKNKTKAKSLIRSYRTIWASAIGLAPYSSVGSSYYKTTDTVYGSLLNNYDRSGGLTNFFFMNAVNINKSISVGLNAGYLFGQIENNTAYFMLDQNVARALILQENYYYKGFKFDLGLQVQHHDTFLKIQRKIVDGKEVIKRKNIPLKFIFGGTINNQAALKYNYSRLALNKSNFYIVNPVDTVSTKFSNGNANLPLGFSSGFSIRYDNLWMLAFDYSSNLYAMQKNPVTDDKYTNSSQYSLGLAYKPDWEITNNNKNKNFLKNIEYRLGLRYFNTGYNFKDNQGIVAPLKEYGLSCGIGMPLQRRNPYTREFVKSSINLCFEYIHRGTTKNGMVDEALYKLTIGITLGDIWFTKSKFN